MKHISKEEMSGKNWYWFKCRKDDGTEYDFMGKFPSAFKSDRWAMKCFHLWMSHKISYLITFYC